MLKKPMVPTSSADPVPFSADAPDIDTAYAQAVALHQAGRLDEAWGVYGQILRVDRRHSAVLANLGAIALQQGRLDEALVWINKSLAFAPAQPFALANRANALQRLRRLPEALATYDQVIALTPGDATVHYGRAVVLHNLKRNAEALTACNQAIALQPDFSLALLCRANILKALGRHDVALADCDAAIAAAPHKAVCHNDRGVVLIDLGRIAEALVSFEQAIALRASYADAHFNRGAALQALGRYDEALSSYAAAVTHQPDHAQAHLNAAIVRLLQGDYAQGWAAYEWRWRGARAADLPRPGPSQLWLGDADLRGKSILLQAEQGLGDAVQFCRYATLVRDLGAAVTLEMPASLVALASSLDPAVTVVARGQIQGAFDYHCPLMSLPFAFKTTVATVPARTPYLFADSEKVRAWAERLGPRTRPRLGMVWAGQPDHKADRNRSTTLAQWQPLLNEDAEFHILQKDVSPGDRAWIATQPRFHLYEPDFSDTAALIANLDVVVSVDTSVAHVAGALGAPVWILLAAHADFRWMTGRTDSPWYPTARLFRQPQPGDWAAVIAAVGEAIRALG